MIKKLYVFISNFLLDIKLRQKLLLSYVFLIIIPLGIFSFLTYEKFSGIIENYVLYSTDQNYDQSYSYISDKLNTVFRMSNIINLEKVVNDMLRKNESSYSDLDQLQDSSDLLTYLKSLEHNNNFYRVRLYVKSEFIFSDENINIFKMDKAVKTKWFKELQTTSLSSLWCPPSYLDDVSNNGIKLISSVKKLKNPNNYNEISGLLRIDLEESLIHDIISRSNSIKNSITYIVNSKGVMVSASNYSQIQNYQINTSAFDNTKVTNHLTRFKTDKMDIFIRSSQFQNTDWTLVTIIPFKDIFTQIKNIRNEIFLLVLIIATLAYAFATYLSYSITNRISRIINRMKDIQKGNLDSIKMVPSKDEIGELIGNYNFMTHRISLLVEEQYKAGFEIKNAELKALQAQINPHFLYNTLDMINCLAQQNRTTDIETAIKALAKFYKLSLSNGKAIISIKDELQHVSFYVQIQNIRYPDKIKLLIDVPDEILEYSILKITLQPIVENSISHGIFRKPDKEGSIKITGRLEDNIIVLSVQDDGIGMSEETLSKILSDQINSKNGSGFGIKNINDRIKLNYGDSYGLTYKSEYRKGTNVEIRIPAVCN